jgi:protein TonB
MTKLLTAVAAIFILAAADPADFLRIQSVPESKILHRVQPVYPPDAIDAHIQGMVRIAITIGKDGRVERARLASGHPLLAPAALQAARQWTFEPFERDGKPIRVMTQVEMPFALPPNGTAVK